ncbi:hypothetical protein PSYRMG_02795 [Pseudomonas syringae UMAF0158]|nr:hypothetical protein PSYRMG_02795 [Pseudomonas syringae UMAF0158]
MRITPHSIALATASHEAISITIVNSRLISASTFLLFVAVLITDSLVRGMFRLIDQWHRAMNYFRHSADRGAARGYTRNPVGSIIGAQVGSRVAR